MCRTLQKKRENATISANSMSSLLSVVVPSVFITLYEMEAHA